MAEFLATFVGLLPDIKQYVIDPLKVQFSYVCCTNSILESLRAEVQRLDDTRDSLQLDIDAARRNLEIVGPDVEHWLERMNEIKAETNRFQARPEVQQGYANGSCLNLKLRYSVSREAKNLTKAVFEVRVAGKFDRVGHPAPPPGMEITPVASGTEFESRKTLEEEIVAALRADSVYLIGICGMGGVGKTTMAKKIWIRAKEEKLFDVVVMPVVSQQVDRKRIQEEIAEALGLKLEQATESIRAGLLHTRLMQEKRILIIIDDIWDSLNLDELGIPSQSNHEGCKIILTSRNRHVCDVMEAMKIFQLDGLREKEAWALFKAKAGTCVDNRDLHQIANDVAKECKGLPLALATVGCALRNQNAKPVWEDALAQLKKSAPLNIPGVLKGVYQPLELSYNHLESNEARYLFLLCCLFPEDSRISLKDLLFYGVGLQIFSNIETLREARNRVQGLVEMLESRSMLMDDGKKKDIKCVKMHDVIRDMAIYIACTGKHVFMINHDTGLEDWPSKDSYESYTSISLTLKGYVTLPECVDCPRLQLLRMRFDWRGHVPDKFFGRMRELNVLDVETIVSLPSSLKFLTNLRTLRLRIDSEMETVSIIGQLVKLEILDFSFSGIVVLPEEIGRLENLKSLDLSRCRHLREIAPGVISSLTRLEELFVLHSFQNWGAEVEGKERRNASVVEVASLKNLIELELEIPNPKALPQDAVHWPKLERFAIFIGISPRNRKDYDGNLLHLNLNETTPLVHCLTRNAHRLRLEDCDNMKYFGALPLVGSFDALKRLDLQNLSKLTHLWDQELCLPNLSKVSIQNCSSFQYVFLQSTTESLSQLRQLYICKCPVLEEVFKAERGRSVGIVGPIVFPNLTELTLKELPNLKSFCKAANGIDFPLLGDPHIESCYYLKVFCPVEESSFFEQEEHNSDDQFLFHQKVTFAGLVKLQLRNINTATKIFSSQISIDSFNRLEQLEFISCPNLKVIFSPPALIRNFRTLGKLTVKNCSKLEGVVGKEDEKSEAIVMEPLFPDLKELILSELPNFKKFCYVTDDIELPQLESITIVDCHQMEAFSLGSLSLPCWTRAYGWLDPHFATQILFKKEVTFANLVELKLYKINTATSIFSRQIPIGSFSLLEVLEVDSCPDLKVIFSPPAFRNFRTLRHLTVKNCSKLEEIAGKEDQETQVAVNEPLFPELKKLMFSNLPNFKKFCQMTNDIELPQLESIMIEDCNQMETFFMLFLNLTRLTLDSGSLAGSLDRDLATQIVFTKEVTFANLVELKLYKINTATSIFCRQIPIGSFSLLELLEVDSCPDLKVIFSPPAFRNFRTLRHLTVKNCSELEEVVGKEDQESQVAVNKSLFPELKKLMLSYLPNFKKFYHMTNDIELPQLESITIEDCDQMETFSLGFVSLPRLTSVFGLLDPNLATQIFFKKEILRNEIHVKNNSFTLWSARDFALVPADLFLAKDSSDSFMAVARPSYDKWNPSKRFEILKLSPGTLYEVVLGMKLEEPFLKFRSQVKLKLTQSEGTTQVRSENLMRKPRGKWIEVILGEFTIGPNPNGDLEFTLYLDDIRHLLIKGVTIRPKA